ncbi:MAG: cytochrome C55X precursor NirC [Hyphomicrobiales bacterium]|nr:MAG: cytochrome C55X precursor NirC [Hyphomicrobiales bacterium]
MIRSALLLSLLLSSAALASAGMPGPARQTQLTHLVRQDCGSCHGMTLKGGLGRALLPENLKDFDKDGLVAIILDGIPGTPMPPWRGLLTEAEAQWIVEKLKTGTLK